MNEPVAWIALGFSTVGIVILSAILGWLMGVVKELQDRG